MLSEACVVTSAPLVAEGNLELALEAGPCNRYANRENMHSRCARFRIRRDEADVIGERSRPA